MGRRGPKSGAKLKGKAAPARAEVWPGFSLPADLDDETAGEFARLSAVLVRKRVADKVDPRLVLAAARTHSLIERAHAELALPVTGETSASLTRTAANGTLMPHPMIAVLNTLTMRLKTLWSEMGLTPASARLTDPKGDRPEGEGWGDLLSVVG